MDTCQAFVVRIQSSWRSCHVDDEVGNLAPEEVGGGPGWVPSGLILVAINDPTTSEVAAGLDHGTASCIADDVGIVKVDDGAGDDIGTRGEVDGSRSRGGTITSGAASVAVADGRKDGVGVIIDAVAPGAVVFDAAEDLVARNNSIGSKALVSNVLEPVVAASSRAGSRRGGGGGGGGTSCCGAGGCASLGGCGGSSVGGGAGGRGGYG